MTNLNETTFIMKPDVLYRKRNRHVVVATIESLVPKPDFIEGSFDPSVWRGGNGDITWEKVQRFYASVPDSQPTHKMPMHFYAEYVGVQGIDDYFVYVGLPHTNKSWFLQEAVAAGVLGTQYADALLIVLQENYHFAPVEPRLWEILADRVLTPYLRDWALPRVAVDFYEKIADPTAVRSSSWKYRFREPKYLGEAELQTYDILMKRYEKR
jgi:hypothetical protein